MRKILAVQTSWNLLGFILPALAAFVATPFLLHRLGTEKFGYLSIVWVVFGVFGLLDLGLGRALTINVARLSALEKIGETRRFIETAVSFILVFGILFSIIVCLVLSIDASHLGQNYLRTSAEYLRANMLVAASLWTVLHGAVLRGALEGFFDFKNSSLVRIFLGVSVFAFPSATVLLTKDLFWIFASIIVARFLANIILILILHKHASFGNFIFDKLIAKQLLKTGGWITVSNTLGPLIVYADRFVISYVLTVSAVTYFSIPADAISRILILPISISMAAFPYFAANIENRKLITKTIKFSTLSCLVLLLPPTIFIFAFSSELLWYWVGQNVAERSAVFAKLLAVGFFVNGMAQVPFSALQALGHARLTALWHCIQIGPYLLGLFYFTSKFGILGTTLTCLVRFIIDTTGMWFLCYFKIMRNKGEPFLH